MGNWRYSCRQFVDSGEFQKALQNAIAQEKYAQDYSLLSSIEQLNIDKEFDLVYAEISINAEGTPTRISNSSLWDVASYNVAKTAADAEVNSKIVAPMPMSPNSVLVKTLEVGKIVLEYPKMK